MIKANKELIRCLNGNRPRKVDELRNGSLLVEVSTEQQSLQIRRLTQLDNTAVSVSEHGHLNQTKGTIYYRNRCNYTNEELQAELSPFNVSNAYRTQKKVGSELIPNNIYIITFNNSKLPEEVNIGWNKCRVREYIPQPRRCFKCKGFQHSSKNCRREDICVNCGQTAHDDDTVCNRQPLCKNCGEQHPASSKECFYYLLAKEIIIIQTREKLSYREARF